MSEPHAPPEFAPQIANPFLDTSGPAAPLTFQGGRTGAPRVRRAAADPRAGAAAEHHLPQGYQSGAGGNIGPSTSSASRASVAHPRALLTRFRGAADYPQSVAYRVPDAPPPAVQASSFPSASSTPAPAKASGGGGFGFGLGALFSLKPYMQYFDVDTADVLHRIRLACVPFGSSFMTTVQDKPDLCVRPRAPSRRRAAGRADARARAATARSG